MKKFTFLIFLLASLVSIKGFSQTVVTYETFPYKFNTSFGSSNNSNGTFSGSSGTWNASVNSNSLAAIAVVPAYYSAITNAIKIVQWCTTNKGASESHAASPTVNLSTYSCSPGVSLTFKLYTYTVTSADVNSYFKVEFSTDNGSNWTSVYSKSSSQLCAAYGKNGLTTLTVDVPSSYRVSTFKYRFSGYKPAKEPNNFYLFVDEAKITATVCSSSTGTIGDFVWNDRNANGLQDSGEPGLTGVTVKLRNGNGDLLQTTTTDGNGKYGFSGLPAGTYKVEFPKTLAGSTLSPAKVGSNDNIDSDPSQSTGLTASFTLSAGQTKNTIDAGYCPTTMSLGNRVWYDTNNNGINDSENGISGLEVYLYKDDNNDNVADGPKIATLTTDANGYYLFTGLVPGNYIVGVQIPAGYMPSSINGGDPDNNINLDNNGILVAGGEVRGLAITLISGTEPDGGGDSNLSYDFGLLPDCGCTNSSGNLLVNPGFENGTTGWSWNSSKGSLTTGTGYVACGSKNGFNNQSSGTAIVYQDVTVVAGASVNFSAFAGTHTAGIGCSPKLSLLFLNASNGVISQIDVAVVQDVQKNFGQLEQYSISAVAPVGTVKARVQSSINCNTMKLDAFCLTATSPSVYSIGNTVWYDINNNGTKDAGEPGIQGVVVKLYDCSGNYLSKAATTDANGNYVLTNVSAGSYIVGITPPAGYAKSDVGSTSVALDNQNDGVNVVGTEIRTNCFSIATSTNNIDFGLKGTGSIGDFVWNDLDGNGIQDAGEPGLQGVTVTLTYPGGSTATRTTNASGFYSFTNLAPATNYSVSFSTPLYFVPSPTNQGGDDTKDSDPVGGVVANVTVLAGVANTTIDAGFQTNILCIGDLVWNDLNDNGLFDIGEPGLPGLTVKLYRDANGDNVPDGAAIATQLTDQNGKYLFVNLLPGNYIVGVTLPTGFSGAATTATSDDPNNDINNDNNGVNVILDELLSNYVTVTSGGEPTNDGDGADGNLSIDFGLNKGGSIGDFVWNDLNGNGLQDPGEPGIPGVIVTLTYPDGTTETTTTDANGKYIFSNLPPGTTYSVAFTAPAGFEETPANVGGNDDIDSDPIGGTASNVVVAAGVVNNSVDAGFQSNQLVIGNLVWADTNNNGFRDAGEPGISGITVKIYLDANGDNIADGPSFATTTTDANGNYKFTGLTPGKYIVGVVLQSGYAAGAVANATPNDDIDNDNNGSNTSVPGEVRTNFVTLTTGGEPTNDGDGPNGNLTIDFGLIITKKGSIGDFVWNDCNNNGLQDAGELGMAGVTVKLTLPGGAIITTATDANGKYTFSNLSAGTYTVCFVTPQPFAFKPSPSNVGADDTKDSDPVSGCVTVVLSGTDNTSVDAGFWDDIDDDNDGIIDIVEGHGYDGLKDCDNDGIPNYLDPTPGCPTPGGVDVYGKPYKPLVWSDCNNDGVNDFFDTDRDGIIDQLDLDSDNDGILDLVETRDPSAVDANRDGMVDGGDDDGDGLLNSADKTPTVCGGPGLLPQDLDRDGIPNYLDLDSDGDGISDLTEARGFFDNDGIADGPDTDGDGVKDVYDGIVGMGAKGVDLMDNDNDGKPNPYDIDSDNDGITDNVEGQPTCNEKQPSGIDSDGDGLDDAYDVNLSSCNRKAAGITPYDKDGDGTPDIYDLDTDNDGVPDVNEGSGISGNFVTNFADTDGDGLIDQFDVFNIKTATGNFTNNVTHSNMGPNGNFDGPLPSGSNAKLPQSAPGNCSTGADRDWRNVFVLPVNLVDFNGNLNNRVTNLYWTSATESNLNNYTIERSVDGVTFVAIGKQKARGNSVINTSYAFADNVSNVSGQVVYYRLSMVDNSGSNKYSNILSFKLSGKASLNIGLYPNPAKTFVQLKINSIKDGMATIRVIDAFGRVMSAVNNPVSVGSNVVNLNNISKLAAGSYFVQVITDGQILNEKLVIAR